MSVLADCTISYDDRPECIASEGGKKYTLYNRPRYIVRMVKADGCFPQKPNEGRCDYLMQIEKIKRAIFIELKGGGLSRAVKQIYSTIVFLKNELKGYQFDARIVGNGDVPKVKITPYYRNLVKEIKSSNGTIGIRTNFYPEEI